MSLLVTGTIGIDTIETEGNRADDVLGGSAAYFAVAAGLMHPVRLVAAVGEDFPESFRQVFATDRIDHSGLEVRKGSKTFRWHGRYERDMNNRESLQTDLNVVGEAPPKIPDNFQDSKYVFLANTHPAVQRSFVEQLKSPKLKVCDTMDLWIKEFREDLLQTLGVVDGLVLNDSEAKLLVPDESDLIACGRHILGMGPKFVVIKKGEHGAMLITNEVVYALPIFPTDKVKDPTGAGDSFAAGMMAHIAEVDKVDPATLKRAMAYGACVASVTIEDFSLAALRAADRDTVQKRFEEYRKMLSFD